MLSLKFEPLDISTKTTIKIEFQCSPEEHESQAIIKYEIFFV